MIHWPLRCFHAAWRTLWKEWDWLVEDSSRIPCISKLPRFGGRHAACAISARSLRTERSLSEGVPRREDGQIERCRVVQETKKLSGTEGRIGRQQRSVILPLEPRNRGYNWDGESRRRKTDRRTDRPTRLRRNEARFCGKTEIDWHFCSRFVSNWSLCVKERKKRLRYGRRSTKQVPL
jgi:hypothetical protein